MWTPSLRVQSLVDMHDTQEPQESADVCVPLPLQCVPLLQQCQQSRMVTDRDSRWCKEAQLWSEMKLGHVPPRKLPIDVHLFGLSLAC